MKAGKKKCQSIRALNGRKSGKMNIIADVNLIEENGLEYIEIIVDSYPFPVNYRGKYYYRSGSTMQEIKGIELL